jgi:oligopeptide transport system substrate-binding protein
MFITYRFLLFIIPFLLFAKEVQKEPTSQKLHVNFLAGEIRHIHPHLIRDTESTTLVKALFEGLTRINLEGKVELALARKIEISKCKTQYKIYLRPSKWSNGEDVTSDHFIKAWKSAFSPDSRCLNSYHFFIIKNVEKVFKKKISMKKIGIYAPNKDQIIIHLEHPAPYFTQLLADPIFSPLYGLNEDDIKVFNGPFIIKDNHFNNNICLQKNPLYWDFKNVKLDLINISHITDPNTVYELFQKGKLDYVGSPFSDLPEEILQHLNNVKSVPACAIYWMYMNINNPKLCSKTIRKALNFAVDREYIAKYILSNAIPSYTILPEEISSFKKQDIKHSKKQLLELFQKGLKEIGYSQKDFVLTISYTATPRHANLAKYLKYQWEKTFNIKVNLDKSDWNTFFSKLNTASFEIGGAAKYVTCLNPLFFLELFYDSKMNKSYWENKEFKKLIDLANNSISDEKLTKYLIEAEKILLEESPIIPIYTHKHLYLCNPKLKMLYPSKLLYQDFKWAYFD